MTTETRMTPYQQLLHLAAQRRTNTQAQRTAQAHTAAREADAMLTHLSPMLSPLVPADAWIGYPTGGTQPVPSAAAALGDDVWLIYTPSAGRRTLMLLRPCPCGAGSTETQIIDDDALAAALSHPATECDACTRGGHTDTTLSGEITRVGYLHDIGDHDARGVRFSLMVGDNAETSADELVLPCRTTDPELARALLEDLCVGERLRVRGGLEVPDLPHAPMLLHASAIEVPAVTDELDLEWDALPDVAEVIALPVAGGDSRAGAER